MAVGARSHLEEQRVARGVNVLDIEPQLGADIPPDELTLARRVLTMPQQDLPPGPWPWGVQGALLGFLIVDGALAHDVLLAGDQTMQLLGPGDLVDPFRVADAPPRARHAWRVLEPTSVVALGPAFVSATRRWPVLQVNLHRHLVDQALRGSVHTALAQLPRVDIRVLAVLWHLTDRWGMVTPAGVVVGLRLTHEALGRLVGARRPTVTLALKELASRGLVSRRDDGLLVLAPSSREVLTDAA